MKTLWQAFSAKEKLAYRIQCITARMREGEAFRSRWHRRVDGYCFAVWYAKYAEWARR